jgi:hypothetical protein
MTVDQITALIRLATYLGASSGSDYLAIQILRASELTEEIKAEKNLILIGQPSRNPLLQEKAIADALPQPFEPGTDLLAPQYDTVVVQQMSNWSTGLLQMFPSPWNPERMILAITGTSEKSVVWGLDALASASDLLTGRLVVIHDDMLSPLDVNPQVTQQSPLVKAGAMRAGEDIDQWLTLAEKWW